jgi:hypothetical protein
VDALNIAFRELSWRASLVTRRMSAPKGLLNPSPALMLVTAPVAVFGLYKHRDRSHRKYKIHYL